VARFFRMLTNIVIGIALLIVLLAAVTTLGAYAIGREFPPTGHLVEVTGGRLHVLELGAPNAPPVVLLHGASGNLQDMRIALGDRLAESHRVILIDRPGHGWSDRPAGNDDASPARQAALIAQALDRLNVAGAIIVGHSFAGAVVTAFALAYPQRVEALVLLAPVTHPWPGGVAWFYSLTVGPIGPLFTHTIMLPIAYPFLDRLCTPVFSPQPMPQDYSRRAAIPLLLRPAEFAANARDVVQLKENVTRQAPRYAEIEAPTVIITGDRDTIVSPTIHSRALAATLPHARLIVLPGVGHAVQHVAADLVVAEIDRLASAKRIAR
jgi:pimeloyl-ACP methyl ester carboxylesterase